MRFSKSSTLVISKLKPRVPRQANPCGYEQSWSWYWLSKHQQITRLRPMPWDMNTLNISGTLNVFRVLVRPALCLPHATVSTFNDLPVPLNKALGKYGKIDIKAVVLDKDDCFAKPHENEIYKPYRVRRIVSILYSGIVLVLLSKIFHSVNCFLSLVCLASVI